MKDDNIVLYTQIISIVGTFIVTIASVIITQIFYKKNQENKEQKEDEINRRNELKEPYEHIMKYINSIPITAPKDIIEKINEQGQYDEIYLDDLQEKLYNQLEHEYDNENLDLIEIKASFYDLSEAISKYRNSNEVYEDFLEYNKQKIDIYAPLKVYLALLNLTDLVNSAFKNDLIKNLPSCIENDGDPVFDNKILIAKTELMKAITKDLDIKK